MRIRYVQGICVLSALAWFPIFVVGLKAFMGVDVIRTFDMNRIIWNVAIGLAVIPPGIRLVRKFGNRMGDEIAGCYSWQLAFLNPTVIVSLPNGAPAFCDSLTMTCSYSTDVMETTPICIA